jgi:hypothetical protein
MSTILPMSDRHLALRVAASHGTSKAGHCPWSSVAKSWLMRHAGAVDRSKVLSLYREGVGAVRRIVWGWSPARWEQPACGAWSATDLAGHLVCVIGWHHAWLDRAEAGDPSSPFPADELAERNRAALVDLRPSEGPERIHQFVELAERYVVRLDSSWAMPYGSPAGTAPAGAHAALAALEWHLHAWDLAAGEHVPSDPGRLLVATSRAWARHRPGMRHQARAAMAPVLARHRAWERLLVRSGRDPAGHRDGA